MRPALRRTLLATVCVSVLVLAACGKHVASTAPITWAPADTPYLIANFEATPADAIAAWSQANDQVTSLRIQQLGRMAEALTDRDPVVARILDALHAELADVHSSKELAQTIGFAPAPLYAVYGIGDAPVVRINLASPDTFKAFWSRVEKRAGVTATTATVDQQTYRLIGSANAKVHLLVAVEDKQLVVTAAPTGASPDLLQQLLGLTKPENNAADRLARINSKYGYGDYGSGYLDPPKLFANLFDDNDAVTQAFARELGVSLTHPACASEFAALAKQVPLASLGAQAYTATEIRYSADVELSPSLLGALAVLKQPVPGMDASADDTMFDLVLALPVKRWQTFLQDRAKAAAAKDYQCPALQPLNRFAKTAANPPVRMPPQVASLLGARLVLDQWEAGPKIAGRALIASSDTAGVAHMLQQTLPQFALKTIPTDGTPVAFPLSRGPQAMLGGSDHGWIAADQRAIVAGVGAGEKDKLDDALSAPAGNGDRLLRLHASGKVYDAFGRWTGRFAAMAPDQDKTEAQQAAALFRQMSKMIASSDIAVKLDNTGLHIEASVKHR